MNTKAFLRNVLTCTWFAFVSSSLAQPTLSVSLIGTQARISWESVSGGVYRVETSRGFPLWNTSSVLTATGSSAGVSFFTEPREFFRVARLGTPNGSLPFRSGAVISNIVTIPITAVGSNGVQCVRLVDATSVATNILDTVDIRDWSRRSFTIDTRLLRNGEHRFSLDVVDLAGSIRTGEGCGRTSTDPIRVSVKNPIALNGFDGFVGQHFYLSFSCLQTSGTWRVLATNVTSSGAVGTPWRQWSGSITGSEIHVFDPALIGSYTNAYFDIGVSVFGSQQTNYLVTRATVLRPPQARNYIVVEDGDYFLVPSTQRFNLESVLGTALSGYAPYGTHFDLGSNTWRADPADWNVVSNALGWSRLNTYTLGSNGISATHMIMWSRGIQGGVIGATNRAPTNQLSTFTLQSLGRSNHLTFALFGGHAPLSLLGHLVDTRKRTFAEVASEGRLPNFGCYLAEPYPSGDDLTDDEEMFWRRFLEHATVRPHGYAEYTYREALTFASLRDNGTANPVAVRFDWVGCIDLYTDEIYLTELPP